ncbi:MAG: cytochrome c biogenesis protein CcdA [Bacteroidota bacterium]|jgi:cytochrome c biogenesis protein CcdA/thioredoxin-related protein
MTKSALPKLLLLLSLLVFPAFQATAQILNPVKWNASVVKTGDGTAELVVKATIEKNWHLYTQNPGEGPLPTIFVFTKSADYQLVGGVIEGKAIKKYEEMFSGEISYYELSATFRQKIKVLNQKPFSINATVEGMACDDGRCVPLDPYKLVFEIKDVLSGAGAPGATGATGATGNQITAPEQNTGASGAQMSSGDCSCDSLRNMISGLNIAGDNSGQKKIAYTGGPCKFELNKPMDVKLEDGGKEEDKSFWGIFIAGLIGGFVALLTPCVFPMIPMTVSFFTKRSKDRATGIRNAMIYALSIIIIYVSLGLLVTSIFGSDALNEMSSNVFFNLLFFVVFIVFAVSFFGAFEIVLPSSLVNKVDQASDRGGLIGILFMAFTLSLVSFSCTGPIIGTLLVETGRDGNFLGPAIGMFGFSLALALPFALFAMFPGWLNSLPKSGGWLNSVKVTLGFVELALALKFLSTVDLAYHWGFLTREVFLSLWIIIAFLLGLYLIGKLKFSHDSDLPFISVPRIMMAIITFSFGMYMIPGLWGAPTSFISGYLPPSYYKEWKDPNEGDCPIGLNCFHDFEEGMCYAKSVGKPVLVDFTGYACVNCRKMEDNVWPNPEVYKLINNDYVLISLYVDDKKELPANKQYTTADGIKVKTYGKKWSLLEQDNFGQNSQPLYVLMDNNGKVLAKPQGYTPDASEYAQYLQKGIRVYKERKVKTEQPAADSTSTK